MATETESAPKPESTFGTRHVVVLLMFLSTTISYCTRVSMSVAIVAMTTKLHIGGNSPTFDWNKSTQDTILSSFFWGYVMLQIPTGTLVGRYGAKYFMLAAMLTTGSINLLTPAAAIYGGATATIVCRVIMGLFQGLLYPSLHGLLGQWSPACERSRMGTFVYAGAQLGTIIEMMVAGILSESSWGWPSIFYLAGAACFAWSAAWVVFGASSPGTSRWISKEERKYIETNAGAVDISQYNKRAVPWTKILTSLPFWAILLAQCGQSLGFWTLLTEMPSYMHKALGVNIKDGDFLSALPYVAMYILSFVFSWLADFLINRKIVEVGTSRKIFNTIAFWGPAATLLGLAYLPPNRLDLAVALLVLTVGLNGAHYVGFLITHIDLSPNFASTLMGITNGCGNIFSIMAPFSVSFVVKDETSAEEWRNVFFISISFYVLTNLFYILFMSGDIQEWNEIQADDPKAEEVTKKEDCYKKTDVGSKVPSVIVLNDLV